MTTTTTASVTSTADFREQLVAWLDEHDLTPPADDHSLAGHLRQYARVQRALLDLLGDQDRRFSAGLGRSDAVESAVRNYELAYRMQAEVPDVLDLGRESPATQRLYGIDSTDPVQRQYGVQCLRARRQS